MKNKLLIIVLALGFLFVRPREVMAAPHCDTKKLRLAGDIAINGTVTSKKGQTLHVTVIDDNYDSNTGSGMLTNGEEYSLEFSHFDNGTFSGSDKGVYHDGKIEFTVTDRQAVSVGVVGHTSESIRVTLAHNSDICSFGKYELVAGEEYSCTIGSKVTVPSDPNYPQCIDSSGGTIQIYGSMSKDGSPYNGSIAMMGDNNFVMGGFDVNNNGDFSSSFKNAGRFFGSGNHEIGAGIRIGNMTKVVCSNEFSIEEFTCNKNSDSAEVKDSDKSGNLSSSPIRPEFCDGGTKQLDTALGCIPTDPQMFIGWVIKLGLGAGAGIAFLMMSVGAFIFMTSQGNPEQIKKGQEIIVGALTGLLFIIFSIFLLKFIGVDILQIPGFK